MTPLLWTVYLVGFVTMFLPVRRHQAEVTMVGVGLQLAVVLVAAV